MIRDAFSWTTRAPRDAYVVALNLSLGFPRVCPVELAAPGATLAHRTTVTAVAKEDALDGTFLCGIYPGEATPVGATRTRIARVGETFAIASRTPIAEPTTRQLQDARVAKEARQIRVTTVDEPTRDGEARIR